MPSLSWILSIMIGSIIFPPLIKAAYADVNFKRVVSAEPKEIDKSSFGFS